MRILVVEEEVDLREILRRALLTAGYEVSACDGNTASILMEGQVFDVLVTDVLGPRRDGVDVVKEFRWRFPGKGVVAMSGGGNLFRGEICLDVAKRLGAIKVLDKPFGRSQLVEAVESAINTH